MGRCILVMSRGSVKRYHPLIGVVDVHIMRINAPEHGNGKTADEKKG
jgi:hypothetical protein